MTERRKGATCVYLAENVVTILVKPGSGGTSMAHTVARAHQSCTVPHPIPPLQAPVATLCDADAFAGMGNAPARREGSEAAAQSYECALEIRIHLLRGSRRVPIAPGFESHSPFLPRATSWGGDGGRSHSEAVVRAVFFFCIYLETRNNSKNTIFLPKKTPMPHFADFASLSIVGSPTPGCDHPDIVDMYNKLSAVYASQQEYDKALECHQKVVQTGIKLHGPEQGSAPGGPLPPLDQTVKYQMTPMLVEMIHRFG